VINFIFGIVLTSAIMTVSISIQKACNPEYFTRVNSFRQTAVNLAGVLGGTTTFTLLIYSTLEVIIISSSFVLFIFSLTGIVKNFKEKVELKSITQESHKA